MTIIGRSLINPPSDPSKLNNARGVIGPRSTEGWKISDINFYNFDNDMVIMETCSKCNDILLYTNTGQEYELEDITYTNVTSKKIHMLGLKR